MILVGGIGLVIPATTATCAAASTTQTEAARTNQSLSSKTNLRQTEPTVYTPGPARTGLCTSTPGTRTIEEVSKMGTRRTKEAPPMGIWRLRVPMTGMGRRLRRSMIRGFCQTGFWIGEGCLMQTDGGNVTTGRFREADNGIARARFWTRLDRSKFLAKKTPSFGRLPCIYFSWVFETCS